MSGWYDHVKAPRFHRALWVVGTSAAGKSTMARAFAAEAGVSVLECGHWIRDMHHPDCGPAELTATTLSILGKDERHFSRLIHEALAAHPRLVVAGSRNPIDFIDNFDVTRDSLVLLGTETFKPLTGFEQAGVATIVAYSRFILECGIIPRDRVVIAEPST